MLTIYERTNIIIESTLCAIKEGKKIYLYGCGQLGKNVAEVFTARGIRIDGFVVDKMFYHAGENVNNIPVLCIEDVLNSVEKKLIIVTHRDLNNKSLQSYPNIQVINEDALSFGCEKSDDTYMDYEFFRKNNEEFEKFYGELCDKKSRVCMEAFLNQKISGKLKYLKEVYEDNQYYDSDIVDFGKMKVIVDCGAYDGDSYLAFLKNYKRNLGKEFNGMAYLLEPDTRNYHLLLEKCGNDKRCKIKRLGAWDSKDVLTFSEEGTSSGITEQGTVSISVDKIDNVIDDQVDFIKMDIEGAEYKALIGAEESIKRCHPVLAVCVYHKKRDLLEIPNLIKSFYPEYRFYLRVYSKYSQELVLYAVPES